MTDEIGFDTAEVDLLMELIAERLEAIDEAHGDPDSRHPQVDQLETVMLKLHVAKSALEANAGVADS
jgi:hypothetical protein